MAGMMPNGQLGLTMAAADLGLGNMAAAQLAEQEAERKKKLQQMTPTAPLYSTASQDLLGKRITADG